MSMWDGFNQRKFPRVNLQCEVLIQADETTVPIAAITENVGAGGVCVILDQMLDRFSKCQIRLHLDDKTPSIDCDGKVIWAVPTGEIKNPKKKFDIGIQFMELEPAGGQRIREFLETHAQKKP